MDGRFEGNSIIFDLEVNGILPNTKKLPVILDTGCTADLILTYPVSFPLGLTLVGIQEYTIADDSKVNFFECIGHVKLGNRDAMCSISIRPSGSSLMGVPLLRKLGYKLEVDFVKNKAQLIELKKETNSTKK